MPGTTSASALGIAGSSVFTLGIATARDSGPHDPRDPGGRHRAARHRPRDRLPPGPLQPFAARETEVTLLYARAGTPAWGPEILARHFWLDTMDELPPLYGDWERWAAAVSESHANYPALIWFRSPVSTRSWLLGLVAMMDSAALYHAVSPHQTPREARLCLSMGISCLRSMAGALQIPYDADPLPTTGIRLTRAEFDEGFHRLERGALPDRARRRRGVAQLPGVAGQLRAHRRRADRAGPAAARPVVRRPPGAGRRHLAPRAQPHPRGARGVSDFGPTRPSRRRRHAESNNS